MYYIQGIYIQDIYIQYTFMCKKEELYSNIYI